MTGRTDEQADVKEQWIELELLGKYHKLFTDKVERTEEKVILVTIRKNNK